MLWRLDSIAWRSIIRAVAEPPLGGGPGAARPQVRRGRSWPRSGLGSTAARAARRWRRGCRAPARRAGGRPSRGGRPGQVDEDSVPPAAAQEGASRPLHWAATSEGSGATGSAARVRHLVGARRRGVGDVLPAVVGSAERRPARTPGRRAPSALTPATGSWRPRRGRRNARATGDPW